MWQAVGARRASAGPPGRRPGVTGYLTSWGRAGGLRGVWSEWDQSRVAGEGQGWGVYGARGRGLQVEPVTSPRPSPKIENVT